MNSVCKRGLGHSGDRIGERFGPECGMQRNPHRPNPPLPTIVLRPLLLSRTQPLRGGPALPARFGEEPIAQTRTPGELPRNLASQPPVRRKPCG